MNFFYQHFQSKATTILDCLVSLVLKIFKGINNIKVDTIKSHIQN